MRALEKTLDKSIKHVLVLQQLLIMKLKTGIDFQTWLSKTLMSSTLIIRILEFISMS